MTVLTAHFRSEYAQHRAAEGRGYVGEALRALPYLRSGPLARQWAVRARSFDALVKHVLTPLGRARALDVLDLGAGNGWLCHRVARLGHNALALDIRDDDVDGLGAASEFLRAEPNHFERVTASFDALAFASRKFDVVIFNASLHYAQDLGQVLAEAARVTRPGGMLAILDSPFYAHNSDGEAMVAEKRAQATARFGARADLLLSQNFIEYLTRDSLAAASPDLVWSRRRVLYPLWYEMRPALAWLNAARTPSRFDLWTARVP
jgi:SAM-dependent methyltransferase